MLNRQECRWLWLLSNIRWEDNRLLKCQDINISNSGHSSNHSCKCVSLRMEPDLPSHSSSLIYQHNSRSHPNSIKGKW